MSKEFEQRFDEWKIWYFEHLNDGGDVDQQVKFLKKALEGMMELMAHVIRDVRGLEGRPRESLGQPLYLPGPMRVQGSLKRFG